MNADADTHEADGTVDGVNIVSAENDAIALADYRLHMQLFRYGLAS